MEPKRRLPLLNATPDEENDGDSRPPWQWVGFGALAIFVVWLPLSWVATLAAQRIDGTALSTSLLRALLFGLGLALAALAGGFLVGRWGTDGVRVREAALAGLAAALVATLLTWCTLGVSLGALATVPIAVPPAAFGGRLGLRGRHRH
jgi:hypothetical protein